MQRLIVKDFGPIKDLDLEIKDYMVFVGPQASGKSTVSKLLYFFERLWKEIEFPSAYLKYLFVSGKLDLDDTFLINNLGEFFVDNLDIFNEFSNKNTYSSVTYVINKEEYIKIFNEGEDSYIISLSDALLHLLDGHENAIKAAFYETIKNKGDFNDFVLRFNFTHSPLSVKNKALEFIPTSRSITTLLSKQLQNFEFTNEDFFIEEYTKSIINIRPFFSKGIDGYLKRIQSKVDKKLIETLVKSILKGEYFFEYGNERVVLEDNRSIPINYASSGQQESLSVLLICIYYMSLNVDTQLHIEEPEAHLYPESQKNMMDLIALFFNSGKNQVVITTHSPYILGSINNLLYAHRVGQKHPEKVNERIAKELWLDSAKVGAYLVDNGRATSIIDEDLNLIENEVIDGIARKINEDFDILFELENP